ncbi:DoxX family protein [Nocardia sp. CC227C]|uniref:DoxX family protein n=1 Tax=Nocardia sp. CC227C TaxID=3044562 RepID=UPI00278C73D8|nr:DoxX family protein [Nocardia sp. CC227C]
MFVATVIVSILLAVMLCGSAFVKLTRREPFVQGYAAIGVPDSWLPWLASALLAGAVGLIVGLWWGPIGIAAAVGLTLYFLGAVGFHIRARDWKNLAAPLVMVALSVVVLVLRVFGL